MKAEKLDKKLLKKFRSGKCTSEEVRKILRWYQSEEADASFSVEIDDLWDDQKTLPFFEKERIYNLVSQKITLTQNPHTWEKKSKQRFPVLRSHRPTFGFLKLEVVFLLLLLSAAALFFFTPHLFRSDNPVARIRMLTREVNQGQKYTIRLSDGTVVKLNSRSAIHYPDKFSDSLRIVEFKGEGFFEVAKDPSRPFVIKSGNMSTTVLGTSFNLRALPANEKFEVAVVTGSIKVSHLDKGYNLEERYLTPNQSAVFDNKANSFTVQPFDADKVLAWTDGTIIFENSSFKEITQTLEDWYGVEIDTSQLARKISKGYTGSYKDKSLESVLDGISYVLDFKYKIEGKNVIIK